MLGYMNRESLAETFARRHVVFFSRSKQRLWCKGETSGNYLEFKSAYPDCDADAILILAEPHGPTCHRGTASCFGDDAVSGDNGYTGHDILYIAFPGDDTVPGSRADWTAATKEDFESSIQALGDSLVVGLGTGG